METTERALQRLELSSPLVVRERSRACNKADDETIYEQPGLYDRLLPVYRFGALTDEGILERVLDEKNDNVEKPWSSVLEIGCGTGRMTSVLREYFPVSAIRGVEPSKAMLAAFTARHPDIAVTRASLAQYLDAHTEAFDLVCAFWSLNYPLLDCFEERRGNEIIPLKFGHGLVRAKLLVDSLTKAVAPGGRLLTFFFDPDTEEQRFVTRHWERFAPFPGTGRDFTRRFFIDYLMAGQEIGIGQCAIRRFQGSVEFSSLVQARQWFLAGHFKSFPRALNDKVLLRELDSLLQAAASQSSEGLRLGAGLYVIVFDVRPE